MKDYKPREPEYRVLVKYGILSLAKNKNVFSLLFVSNHAKLREKLKHAIKLKYIPIKSNFNN